MLQLWEQGQTQWPHFQFLPLLPPSPLTIPLLSSPAPQVTPSLTGFLGIQAGLLSRHLFGARGWHLGVGAAMGGLLHTPYNCPTRTL